MATWHIEHWREADLLDRLKNHEEDFLIELNHRDVRGYYMLHVAAKRGFAALCAKLLELGERADQVDREQYTPLHFAAATGHVDVVRTLLNGHQNNRANVNALSSAGCSALHYAALYGFGEIVSLLLERGADPLLRARDANAQGQAVPSSTALHYACVSGHVDCARRLLGSDNARRALGMADVNGYRPLSLLPLREVSAARLHARVVTATPSALSNDLLALLKSGDHFDVEFNVDGGGVRAHRLVLQARLPALLERAVASSHPIQIALQGVNAATVQRALEWAYSGSIALAELQWAEFRALLDFALQQRLAQLSTWLEVTLERNVDEVSYAPLLGYVASRASELPHLALTLSRYVAASVKDAFASEMNAVQFPPPLLDFVLHRLAGEVEVDTAVAPPLTAHPLPPQEWRLHEPPKSRTATAPLQSSYPPQQPHPYPQAHPHPQAHHYPPQQPVPQVHAVRINPPAPVPAPAVFTDADKERLLQALAELSENNACMNEVELIVKKYNIVTDEIDLSVMPVPALVELRHMVSRYLQKPL